MKTYLSKAEAAEMLGVSQQTISNYVERGLLAESRIRSANTGMRILSSSVIELMNEGYDIIKQTKAIESTRTLLAAKDKEYRIERDNLDKIHRLLKISDGFHKNIKEIAEILSAYLVANEILPKKQTKIVINLLAGRSFKYIADNSGLSVSDIKDTYRRAVESLYDKKIPTYADLKEENSSLREQLQLMHKKNSLLEEEKNDALKRVHDISEAMHCGKLHSISIPKQLVGQDSLKTSVRLSNVLKASNIENLYDLALISMNQLSDTRNFGKKCMDEILEIMNRYLIEFDNIDSLQNSIIRSLPGPFIDIPVYVLEMRRKRLCREE